MNIYPCFPHSLFTLVEIRYEISGQSMPTAKKVRISWKSDDGGSDFSDGCKLNYLDAHTVKLHGVLSVQKALVNHVRYFANYAQCSVVYIFSISDKILKWMVTRIPRIFYVYKVVQRLETPTLLLSSRLVDSEPVTLCCLSYSAHSDSLCVMELRLVI